ncbi:MAG: S8 family serine peptidase [Planctomycetaceae bacterium]
MIFASVIQVVPHRLRAWRLAFTLGLGLAALPVWPVPAADPPRQYPGLPEGTTPYDWALEQLQVPAAHARHRGRPGFVVAVIDLGYRHHPDLEGHLWVNPNPTRRDVEQRQDLHGWDFADDDGSLEYNGPQAESAYYTNHHVFVAGEVAAVAPECRLMILRVSYRNHDSWYQAVDYAVRHGAKVLVMPHGYIGRAPGSEVPLFYQGTDFTWPEDNPKLRESLDNAYDAGCLVFSGTADNRGRRVAFFPVASEAVCAVGSSNRTGEASNMAADADYVEFSAPAGQRGTADPGQTVWGLGGRQDYTSFEGGCMACSFAGGVAALVWSRHPEWTNDQLRQVLRNTARGQPRDAHQSDRKLGYGILSADEALALTDDQLTRDVRLVADSLKITPCEGGFRLRGTLHNHGVWDARKAMVVVYNGDPTQPRSSEATLDQPGPELQTRQLGHAVTSVRGLHESGIAIDCAGAAPAKVWFEVYCLDRRSPRIHRLMVNLPAPPTP